MSTEHQTYSLEHQRIANAAYALEHGIEIVRSYADAGVSGLGLHGRDGLKRLLADALSGGAGFSTILTYDVSRWGRFQDPDQSAHYEFICREAGVHVVYCAEPFSNDGSLTSTLVKHLKRAMAAEYSRELGVRISAACHTLAARGFRMSGPPGYGLRRLILDPDNCPVGILAPGERKAVQNHRIMLVPGPPGEVAVVRRIYRAYTRSGQTQTAIARTLNAEDVPSGDGRPWTRSRIKEILTNEKYVGNNVYGRWTQRLGVRGRPAGPETWTRRDGAFPGLVGASLFARAAQISSRRTVDLSDADMLTGLTSLLAREGFLSARLINDCPRLPCVAIYAKRFGGLTNAYRLIGYDREAALRQRCRTQSEAQMLAGLATLRAKHGKLSAHIINATAGIPGAETYAARFGGLAEAYRRIGYDPLGTGHDRPRADARYDDQAMVDGLKALFEREGRLTTQLINADPDIPSRPTYARRFGSLPPLYKRVGFKFEPTSCVGRQRGPKGRLLPGNTPTEMVLQPETSGPATALSAARVSADRKAALGK